MHHDVSPQRRELAAEQLDQLLALAVGAPTAALVADKLIKEPSVGLMTALWSVGLASAFCAALFLTAFRD